MDEPTSWFKERLHAARRQRGFTIQALAEEIGVTRARVSAWESGAGLPDLGNLVMLCQVLRASADFVLGLDLALAAIPESEILWQSPFTDDARRRERAIVGTPQEGRPLLERMIELESSLKRMEKSVRRLESAHSDPQDESTETRRASPGA